MDEQTSRTVERLMMELSSTMAKPPMSYVSMLGHSSASNQPSSPDRRNTGPLPTPSNPTVRFGAAVLHLLRQHHLALATSAAPCAQ